jgi:electron transfer flavoprotein alpha subunit
MAARNKRVRSTHQRASRHREELLEEARSLMSAGRVREARAVESRAGQVAQLVGALESDIRAESEMGDAPETAH